MYVSVNPQTHLVHYLDLRTPTLETTVWENESVGGSTDRLEQREMGG